jgi:protein-L-isoaspartate(D-aspartate) O-methyltransferase
MPDTTALRTMMVDTQVRPSDVTKFPIIQALLEIEREAFVPASKVPVAYMDEPIVLVPGRVLADARSFAKMLDALELERGELVLDLGCGLGYSSAVLARMVDAVVAVEEDSDMARDAEATLGEKGIDNVAVLEAPLTEGAPNAGPYDVIVIGGGVEMIPASIEAQLKEGGRIAAVFVKGALGACKIGHKSNGRISWRMAFNTTMPVLPGFALEKGFAL